MAVSVFKTFISGETLTASDLNSSLTQITSNGEDLGWPATKAKDFNSQNATDVGVLNSDDTTDTTSGASGSIHTTGGVGIAKKLYVVGNITTEANLVLSSGQGIDFSATSDVATMTSELLDDYEEGTWVVEATTTTGSGSPTYSSQLGLYVKIGSTAFIQGRLAVTWASRTGNIKISGLPFTMVGSSFCAICVGGTSDLAVTAGQSVVGEVESGAATIQLYLEESTTGSATDLLNVAADCPTNLGINFEAFYRVA